MATDTNINQLIINKLTQAQYQEAKEAGNISETELYLITDGDGGGSNISVDESVIEGSTNPVSGGAVYQHAVKKDGDTMTGTLAIKANGGIASVFIDAYGNINVIGHDSEGFMITTDYDTGDGYVDGVPIASFVGGLGDEPVVIRNIESPIQDSDVANKKYVDEAVANAGGDSYSYGTTDLTAGTSELETGKLYFVYE